MVISRHEILFAATRRNIFRVLLTLALFFCRASLWAFDQTAVDQARANAALHMEIAGRVHRTLRAVLLQADSRTGLIPNFFLEADGSRKANRKGRYDLYSPHHSGADLYPFLILGAYFTEPELLDGRLMEMLASEMRYTNSWGDIPVDYDLRKRRRKREQLFGAAEYAKDGLITVTERLGITPWYMRMREMTIDVMERSRVETRFGRIPSDRTELNGDLLQVLPRLYWISGDPRFLRWSRRIADAYIYDVLPYNYGLPGDEWNFRRHSGRRTVKLRDHGNETAVGLSLAYAAEKFLNSKRAPVYEKRLRTMFDRILRSANVDGMLYNSFNPKTLRSESRGYADNWGYVYGAAYNLYLLTGDGKYRDAVRKVLANLPKYRNYSWEGSHYDGYADAIESAIYLVSREPEPAALEWIDSEIQQLIGAQGADGHLDRSYLEGNFIRTCLLYMAAKSQGTSIVNWVEGAGIGAVREGSSLLLSISGPAASWDRMIRFDYPRHNRIFGLPLNIVRLNESPEWFTVSESSEYTIARLDGSDRRSYSGAQLMNGVALETGEWVLSAGDVAAVIAP